MQFKVGALVPLAGALHRVASVHTIKDQVRYALNDLNGEPEAAHVHTSHTELVAANSALAKYKHNDRVELTDHRGGCSPGFIGGALHVQDARSGRC